jgi:hypothetical protein
MIEPTVELFYSILTDKLGCTNILASRTISKIHLTDSPSCPTLSVDENRIIRVNKKFWKKWIIRKTDAEFVFLHELFHVVLGDLEKKEETPEERMLANLSMDMRINAAITQSFLDKNVSNDNFFLSRFYKPNGISGLLRPYSAFSATSKYKRIYSALYGSSFTKINPKDVLEEEIKELFRNEESIRSALKLLIPKEELEKMIPKVVFIGTHAQNGSEAKEEERGEGPTPIAPEDIVKVPQEYLDEIRQAIAGKMKSTGKMGGLSNLLVDNMIEVLDSKKSVTMKALERFSCNHKVNSIKGMFQKDKKVTSVIPIRPSSRDMFLMSQNAMPVLWHNKLPREAKKNKNIAIYLDVSGSVTSMLPMLLGFIKNMNRSIKTIYCFSNIVSEHSIQELSNGVFKTTGGTDFNCIAQHVLDNKQIDKAVIFTDGFADISNNLKAPLKAQLKDAAVVYFGSYVNKNNFFAKEYKKGFDLDELVQ